MNEFFTLCTVFIKVTSWTISLIYEKIYFGDRVPSRGGGILATNVEASHPLDANRLQCGPSCQLQKYSGEDLPILLRVNDKI